MEIVHFFPQIKSVSVRSQLIASCFHLSTSPILCNLTTDRKHILSHAPASISICNGEFQYFCDGFCVVQLVLHT